MGMPEFYVLSGLLIIALVLAVIWISGLYMTISTLRRLLAIRQGDICELRDALTKVHAENRELMCNLNMKSIRCSKLEERLDEFEHYII